MAKSTKDHEIGLDEKGQEQPLTKDRALDPSSKDQSQQNIEREKADDKRPPSRVDK